MGGVKNLSIQKKLFLLSGVMLLCLFIVIYISLQSMSSINTSQKTLFEVEYPTTLNLSKLSIDLSKERFALRRMLAATSYPEKVSWHEELMQLKSDINEKIVIIQKLNSEIPEIAEYFNDFLALRDSFLAINEKVIIPAIYEKNKSNKESDSLLAFQSAVSENMRQDIFMAGSGSEENNKIIIERSKEELDMFTRILIIVGIITLLFAILSSVYLVNITAKPLVELNKISEKVAYGDLSINIPSQSRTDEIGALWLSFSMMVGTLRSVTKETSYIVEGIVSDIGLLKENQSPESIKEQINGIQEKIEKLDKLIGEYKF